jgi:prepilin-type N-terminal cleavage/methylation domain-containing protein
MRRQSGFTLIELVAVIVIVAILATIAIQKLAPVAETVKVEETKQEMDLLVAAIIGNADLHNNGTRNEFGYVGDVGALPPNLDALVTNPGYATWNGPYINNDFEQMTDDYKKDAWQTGYTYSGGVAITSTGSGNSINRRLATSADHFLRNNISGNLFDLDGTPPGNNYKDSVTVRVTIPNGAGSNIIKTSTVDAGGYFAFDSIPIGNHGLELIYMPNNDTLRRFVSVQPNSNLFGEYFLAADIWNSGGGSSSTSLEFVANSDSLTSGNCFKLIFWITNNTGGSITVSSLTLTWASPTAYFKDVIWDGITVRTGNPALGSGDAATFGSNQTINDGQTVRVQVEQFHQNSGGSRPPVDMTGAGFTVDFSDGSTINFTADLCVG